MSKVDKICLVCALAEIVFSGFEMITGKADKAIFFLLAGWLMLWLAHVTGGKGKE